MKANAVCYVLLAVLLGMSSSLRASELIRLNQKTWDKYVPRGKEVDCIYGDFVLRNGQLVAVIADPVAGRNANMTVRNVRGALIDLTRRDPLNDQLSAYYPGSQEYPYSFASIQAQSATVYEVDDLGRVRVEAEQISVRVAAPASEGKPAVQVRYTLTEGSPFVLVESVYTNTGSGPIEVELKDEMRADRSFEKAPNEKADLFWVYDKWFGQAYGLIAQGRAILSDSNARNSTLRFVANGSSRITLQAGESHRLVRRVFPGSSLLAVRQIANDLSQVAQHTVKVAVNDSAGAPVPDADVVVTAGDNHYASGRTGQGGRLDFDLPAGAYTVAVSALGRGSRDVAIEVSDDTSLPFELEQCGTVTATVSNSQGGPTPCKVQFLGKGGTNNPNFGPDSGEHAVGNVYYSHDGRFRQPIGPGSYDVIVSYGPEFDAVFTEIEVARGETTPLEATLVRSVETAGWVSSDFHSHASPSGDNTASQFGRVLNLLCEHVEFAPCTEHNRLSTYDPHLRRLGVEALMATCVGLELTGRPGTVNHQNAFPLIRNPRTQDGGAPLTDADPEVQIERLALWDNKSDKLVQANHPDVGEVFFDKDGDGTPDGGFQGMFGYMDVMEVHPPHTILQPARYQQGQRMRNNTIFNWLQLLNQGYHLPGVVNTDAHYNFHGSGFLRNYLKSSTDDPAGIDTMEMVHAAERGNVIMTSGPYLEVQLRAEGGAEAIAGDDLAASSGKATLHVRVQCPNWFDVDRVQVLLNGKPAESLNFTRQSTPNRFADGVVKFDQQVPLAFEGDTHVIVVAIADHSKLGPVMGPDHANDTPAAVSNPIFVDVDGGGFKPNGDTLGAPLPVKAK